MLPDSELPLFHCWPLDLTCSGGWPPWVRGGHKLRDVGAYVEGCRALQLELDGLDATGSGGGTVASGQLSSPLSRGAVSAATATSSRLASHLSPHSRLLLQSLLPPTPHLLQAFRLSAAAAPPPAPAPSAATAAPSASCAADDTSAPAASQGPSAPPPPARVALLSAWTPLPLECLPPLPAGHAPPLLPSLPGSSSELLRLAGGGGSVGGGGGSAPRPRKRPRYAAMT